MRVIAIFLAYVSLRKSRTLETFMHALHYGSVTQIIHLTVFNYVMYPDCYVGYTRLSVNQELFFGR